jgi:hypothetical protein
VRCFPLPFFWLYIRPDANEYQTKKDIRTSPLSHALSPTIHPTPPKRYYPGFARKEHDAGKDESWSIWETDADDYDARFLGPDAGWFAVVGGNKHQAMWMATREQVRVRV